MKWMSVHTGVVDFCVANDDMAVVFGSFKTFGPVSSSSSSYESSYAASVFSSSELFLGKVDGGTLSVIL